MMRKRVRNGIIAAALLVGSVCLLFGYMGMRVGKTYLFADVGDAAILSEYPEMEMTEKDQEWLDSLARLEQTQSIFSSVESVKSEFRLSDTGLADFYQLPGNDASISIEKETSAEADDSAYMFVTFEPVTRDQKVLKYGFFVSYGENSECRHMKTLNVYQQGGEPAMTFDNCIARYYNIDGSFLTEVPGVYLAWADMTILRFTFPRAEILSEKAPNAPAKKEA